MTPSATMAPNQTAPSLPPTSGRADASTRLSEVGQPSAPSQTALAAAALLEQAIQVVGFLSDSAFCTPSSRIAGGTIGKHFRHSLDHFVATLASLTDDPESVIDYDHRCRNVPMEACRTTAAAEFRAAQSRVLSTAPGDLARPVIVRVMLTSDGQDTTLPSTFGRELAFAAHHAIHHHAMIKAIAEEFGIATPAEFGKAPSTLNFERDRSPPQSL